MTNWSDYDKVGRDIFDTFEMALSSLERMTNSLPRLESYKATFDLDTARLLHAPLTSIYTDMLELCLKAIKLYRRGRMSMYLPCARERRALIHAETLLRSTWRTLKRDFDLLIVRVEANRDEVDKFALAQHMLDSKAHYEVVEGLHQTTHGMYFSHHAGSIPWLS